MKTTTQLILAFGVAGVAANLAAGDWAADKTSDYPMAAAGAEGLVALGGAWWALKKSNKIAAIASGAAAGLLVARVRAGLNLPPPPVMSPGVAATMTAPSAGLALAPRQPAAPPAASGFSISAGDLYTKPELLR